MTDFVNVDRVLDQAVGVAFPAAQLVVVDRFSLVHERAVGACDAQTWFDVASLTKALSTATLTMLAVERGQLSLDDRPRPELTVAQLLEHASGLPAWRALGADRDQVLRAAAAEPLEAAPGIRARYSDLGFILLGVALERACGRPLDALFAEAIAAPLALEARFGPCPPERCAPTEGELRGVVHDENARALGGVAGHAGLFATGRDVSRIAHSLVAAWHGVRGIAAVLPPTRVRQMWTPSHVPGSTWCLGWDRPSPTGSSAGERWPKDGVGHLGFTGCSLWIDPARARWVVLLSNRVHPTRANERVKELRPQLHDAIVAALDG
jgi:CubicO group peptidase (beta-lactamase class C family)